MATKEKQTFSYFFKEDADTIRDIVHGGEGQKTTSNVKGATKYVVPIIPKGKEVKEDKFRAEWRKLRSFFRNGDNTKGLPNDLAPTILAPIYTDGLVSNDFPVWVADEKFEDGFEACLPFSELIAICLQKFAPGDGEAKILKENIERLIQIAKKQVVQGKPKLFQPLANKIINELAKQLDVSGDEAYPFEIDLKKLREALPSSGVLLPFSSNTSLQILEASMVRSLAKSRKTLKQDIIDLKCRLNDILRVEREKGPERKNPDKLHDSLSFVDAMLDFKELSSILPTTGSESMEPERVKRIQKAVQYLEESESILDQHGFVFVDESLHQNSNIDWDHLFEDTEIKHFKVGEGSELISSAFFNNIKAWIKLFGAKRIGELEFENSYYSDVHDNFFEHFEWQNFSQEELNCCPYFILIADDIGLFENDLSKLASSIANNIPIKIIGVKRNDQVDFRQNGSTQGTGALNTHTEISGLMLSHKNIYVSQSTSITPKALYEGFTDGLTAFSPAFFYLLNDDEKGFKNSHLLTSAMIESRDFPGFTFNGLLGTPWGSRFDIQNNPQPKVAWPVHELTVIADTGEKIEMQFPFTFADKAVLLPANQQYFLPVDPAFWCQNLVPLTEYMAQSDEENLGRVPFIWMMNKKNELTKVVVSWSMVVATQERLDFWRFLQENSGINNFHVANAVEATKEEMQSLHENEIVEIKAAHRKEIQEVRDQEAGQIMENLTSVLLNLDTSGIAQTNIPNSTPSSSPVTTSDDLQEPSEAVVEEEEDEELTNDPYIDTALCTSCNECTDINGLMFKYNADKMAYVADPNAGTFQQIVAAAEKCPVKIIHPGSPLNPDEADLENLVERAHQFN